MRLDPDPKRAHCKACNAWIYWALTKDGKWMPVDAEVNELGNVVLDNNPGQRAPLARVLGNESLFDTAQPWANGERRHAHFTTCPNPDQFKKKRKPRR